LAGANFPCRKTIILSLHATIYNTSAWLPGALKKKENRYSMKTQPMFEPKSQKK